MEVEPGQEEEGEEEAETGGMGKEWRRGARGRLNINSTYSKEESCCCFCSLGG
jgi:hypothetical protein